MEIDIAELPQHILNDVDEYYKAYPNDCPAVWTVESVLSAYLQWNGIIGYENYIMSILKAQVIHHG